ncbi:hypothetical protein Tco_1046882, partial [Tanacetum coccineum]
MTDVELVKDLHTTNCDQLHAYLGQHEIHANEVHIMRERNQDPLALGRQGQSYSGTSYKSKLLVLRETDKWTVKGCYRQGLLNATTVKVKDIWLGNACSLSDQGMQHDQGFQTVQSIQTIIPKNVSFQTEDLDDSLCYFGHLFDHLDH